MAMLEEMIAAGYPKRWIAERIIWKKPSRLESGRTVANTVQVTGKSGRIHRNTAERIEALYSKLRDNDWLNEDAALRVRMDRHRRGPGKSRRKPEYTTA
jgi:hypothetical protein